MWSMLDIVDKILVRKPKHALHSRQIHRSQTFCLFVNFIAFVFLTPRYYTKRHKNCGIKKIWFLTKLSERNVYFYSLFTIIVILFLSPCHVLTLTCSVIMYNTVGIWIALFGYSGHGYMSIIQILPVLWGALCIFFNHWKVYFSFYLPT